MLPTADREFQQRPIAFIKRRKGTSLTQKTLQKSLAKHLPRFKIPEHFYIWPYRTEQNENLKLRRQSLLKLAEENSSQLKRLAK